MMLTDLLITFVLLESFQTTVSVRYHLDVCSDTTSCEVNTSCVLSVDNTTRCLCPDDEYRNDKNQCVNNTVLQVQDVRTVKVTLNSVKLSWSSLSINNSEAKYNVSYDDTYILGAEDGVTIYNLKSDTEYKFTIQVILFKNQYYKARYGLPGTYFAQTLLQQDSNKKPHGEPCNKSVDTCQNEMICVQYINLEDRCLCDKTYYWNDHNECISKSTLTIKNFTAVNISSTSVELSWSIDSLYKTSAQFKVLYGPIEFQLIHRDKRFAKIDKLQPEAFYTFTIKVEIPADKNYDLTEGPSSNCTIQTKPDNGTNSNSNKSNTTRQAPGTVLKLALSTTTLAATTLSTTKSVIPLLGHGDLCQLPNPPCEPGTSCVESPNKQYRCLCNDTQYWSKNRICVPFKGFTVTEVRVTQVTNTSVQLSWSNRSIEKLSAAYSVRYRSKSLGAQPGGINITNLKPSVNYSFEIFVTIPSEHNYKEKRGPGVSISVQTVAENQTPVFQITTPTQAITLPTETPSSSRQGSTYSTLATTASGESSTNIVIVVIVVLLVVAVVFIVIVVLVVRRKNSERKSLTQFLLDKYDKLRNAPQPEHVYTELEPNTYSTSQDIATNTMNATNHNLPSPSNGASSPSAYYNCKAQEEVKVETIYSHLSHFKGQERENTENVYDG